MHVVLERFASYYSRDLVGVDMATLDQIYDQNILFLDPAHNIEGLESLIRYFSNMMHDVKQCHFNIHSIVPGDMEASVVWRMDIAHPRLRSGASISVDGMTHLKFNDDKITYHRDYFDLGAMLYEHIPLMGGIVRSLKKRLAA